MCYFTSTERNFQLMVLVKKGKTFFEPKYTAWRKLLALTCSITVWRKMQFFVTWFMYKQNIAMDHLFLIIRTWDLNLRLELTLESEALIDSIRTWDLRIEMIRAPDLNWHHRTWNLNQHYKNLILLSLILMVKRGCLQP